MDSMSAAQTTATTTTTTTTATSVMNESNNCAYASQQPMPPHYASCFATHNVSSTAAAVLHDKDAWLPILTVGMRESRIPARFAGACRDIDDFAKGKKIGEGSYGVVYRVQDITDNSPMPPHFAVKRVRMEKNSGGFPIPSLREVAVLRTLKHPNIVQVKDVVAGLDSLDKIYMLMEFCDRDLASLLDSMPSPFSVTEVACIMKQILHGVRYLHSNFIIHRDLKLANLLVSNSGTIKIGDFGLARKFSHPVGRMTPNVVTLWYRAPELLFGEKCYTTAVDNWSIGCVFAELVQKKPLWPGQTEMHQVKLICGLIGSPTDDSWPGWKRLPHALPLLSSPSSQEKVSTLRSKYWMLDDDGFLVLQGFLTYDPQRRLTAARALDSSFFCKLTECERIITANPHVARQVQISEQEEMDLRKLAAKHRKKRRL